MPLYRHIRRIAGYASGGKEPVRGPVWRVTPSDRDQLPDDRTSIRASLHIERLDTDVAPVELGLWTSSDGDAWIELDALVVEKGDSGRLTRELPMLRYVAVRSEGPPHRVRVDLVSTAPFEIDAVPSRVARDAAEERP